MPNLESINWKDQQPSQEDERELDASIEVPEEKKEERILDREKVKKEATDIIQIANTTEMIEKIMELAASPDTDMESILVEAMSKYCQENYINLDAKETVAEIKKINQIEVQFTYESEPAEEKKRKEKIIKSRIAASVFLGQTNADHFLRLTPKFIVSNRPPKLPEGYAASSNGKEMDYALMAQVDKGIVVIHPAFFVNKSGKEKTASEQIELITHESMHFMIRDTFDHREAANTSLKRDKRLEGSYIYRLLEMEGLPHERLIEEKTCEDFRNFCKVDDRLLPPKLDLWASEYKQREDKRAEKGGPLMMGARLATIPDRRLKEIYGEELFAEILELRNSGRPDYESFFKKVEDSYPDLAKAIEEDLDNSTTLFKIFDRHMQTIKSEKGYKQAQQIHKDRLSKGELNGYVDESFGDYMDPGDSTNAGGQTFWETIAATWKQYIEAKASAISETIK